VLKPIWSFNKYHSLETHEKRMDTQKETLQKMHLNDLYADEKLVGKEFDRDELWDPRVYGVF